MSTAVKTTTRAAIFRGHDAPQEIADVELGPLRDDDVIVRMRAVGICGSDLHMLNGDWIRAQPMVLGHEGAGVVSHVGPDVTNVSVGDHVALCWAAPCGRCVSCAQGAPQRCVPVRAAITEGTLTTRLSVAPRATSRTHHRGDRRSTRRRLPTEAPRPRAVAAVGEHGAQPPSAGPRRRRRVRPARRQPGARAPPAEERGEDAADVP
ncbi:MAG: hypothetical protein E6G10_29075 [Actinobacteria bacterium]|nr:MAG: hypothetical protein E6G10_29075 [Actinomycetota bacterium]